MWICFHAAPFPYLNEAIRQSTAQHDENWASLFSFVGRCPAYGCDTPVYSTSEKIFRKFLRFLDRWDLNDSTLSLS